MEHRDWLVENVRQDIAECWQQGARRRAEEFFDEQPLLREDPDALAQFLAAEAAEAGDVREPDKVYVERFQNRFPDRLEIADRLGRILSAQPATVTLSQQPAAATSLPARLGSYIVRSEIGRTRLGVVYLAEDGVTTVRYALKTLRQEILAKLTSEERARHRARFIREMQATTDLKHPHIVQVYSPSAAPDEMPYLPMEYLGGGSLLKRIETAPLPVEQVLGWFSQVTAAVAFAHERGVFHRDIKPANILLDEAGTIAKLADFGLVGVDEGTAGLPSIHPRHNLTQYGDYLGTPAYSAPELLRRNGCRASPRTEVYSLGATLYHLLARRSPSIPRAMSTSDGCRLGPCGSRGLTSRGRSQPNSTRSAGSASRTIPLIATRRSAK
jgi:serine/threonine protein kinase